MEEIRVHAGKRARAVLKWNERFLHMQSNANEEGRERVKTMEEGSKEERMVKKVARERRGKGALGNAYRRLVGSWQKQDIYRLWLPPMSSQLLFSHLGSYFPDMWPVPGENEAEKRDRVEKIWRKERIHWRSVRPGDAGEDQEPDRQEDEDEEGDEEEVEARTWCLGFVRDASEWNEDRKTFCRSRG